MATLSPFYVPDISFWQYRYKTDGSIEKYVDFNLMALKSPGVILRAGQGIVKDKVFDVSWKAAGSAGLSRGTYWFYDPRVEPKRQAEAWAQATAGLPHEMEFWADFERLLVGGQEQHGYDNPHQWYDFMEYAKQLMPSRKFGVYTGYYYWRERFIGPIPLYWKQYPLWIAAYGPSPLIPQPWTDYLFWQFTDNGSGPDYGVASLNIDLNSFNGTLTDFKTRYPTTQEKQMTTRYQMTALQDGTRARSSTSTVDGSNVLTVSPQYLKGTVFGGNLMVNVASPTGVWMEVTEVNGQPVTKRYVARTYNGVTVCGNFIDNGPVVVPPPAPSSDVDIQVSLSNGVVTKIAVNGTPWMKA